MMYTTLPAEKGTHVVINHNDVMVTGKTSHGETVNVLDVHSTDNHPDVETVLEEIKRQVQSDTRFDRIVF